MLRLRQEVCGYVSRIGVSVGEDDDLAGPGNGVDSDLTENQLLGGGNVNVARPYDLVDPRNGLGAKRQGGNGLGPSDLINVSVAWRGRRRAVAKAINSAKT